MTSMPSAGPSTDGGRESGRPAPVPDRRSPVDAAAWAVFGLAAALIALAFWAAQHSAHRTEARMRTDFRSQAEIVAQSLSPARIRALSFTTADAGNPVFLRLRRQLRTAATHLDLQAVYTVAQRDGRFVFGPESYDEDHPHASPPGTIYEQPPPEVERVFETRRALATLPYRDEYGTFVSALVPLVDQGSGEVLVLVGMDILAEDWADSVARARLPPFLFLLVLLAILFAGHALLRRRARLSADLRWRLRFIETLWFLVFGLLLTAAATLALRDTERWDREQGMRDLARAQAAAFMEELRHVGLHLDALTRFLDAGGPVSRDSFARFTAGMDLSGAARRWMWIPIVAADAQESFLEKAREEGLETFALWEWDDRDDRIPASARPVFYPLLYAQPWPETGPALGYDFGANPVFRAAIEEALRTGLRAASGVVSLRALPGDPPGLLVFQPVSSGGREGMAAVTVPLEALLPAPRSLTHDREIGFSLDWVQLDPDGPPLPLAAQPALHGDRAYHVGAGAYRFPILFGGKTYALLLGPCPACLASQPLRAAWIAGFAGVLLTLLLTLIVGFFSNRKEILQHEIARRTAELRERERDLALTLDRESRIKQVLLAVRNVNQLIVRETDRRKLIEGACIYLAETMGYFHTWIALTDEGDDHPPLIASSGRPGFKELRRLLEQRRYPLCMRKALAEEGLLVIASPAEECPDCPMRESYPSASGWCIRLKQEDKIYGVLGAFLPTESAHDREQHALFEEVAGDLAFALHKIETAAALREKDVLIRTVMDHLPIGIAVNSVEPEVTFRYLNDRFPEIYGTTREALEAGDFWEVIYAADPEQREALRRRVLADCASGDPERMRWEDVPVPRAGHAPRTISSQNIPIPGSNLMISTVWDVTARKQAEEEVRAALRETRRLLKQADRSRRTILSMMEDQKRTAEEKEALSLQLLQAQKLEAVGRLAGGVAHDFNNLLQVILGHTDLVLGRPLPDDALRADLREIQVAARRSSDLTRQLLAFARKQTAEPKVLDLNETIAGLLKMLHRLIGEDIHLVWKPGNGLRPVRMDPTQVDQIMANLVVNARDAMAVGGVLTIETANEEASAETPSASGDVPGGGFVMLSVGDTGRGIDPETLPHIFEPFFTTKGVGEGSGLGLATVYGIVEQNNGRIEVDSRPGEGSTFRLRFPALPEESRRSDANEPPPEESAQGKETILLAEDESMILKVARRMLERLDYIVLTARDAEEALARAKDCPGTIHLLITDVVMPGMSGKELSDRLTGLRPGLRTLYVSGYTAEVIARRGIVEEGVAFLQKPFTFSALAAKVRDALDA